MAASAAAWGADHAWEGVERIVAVGDVHGDYEQFAAVLRSAGVIDDDGDWTGGKTHLVQTGDVPDRGPDTRKILDLLQKLEKQAKKAKGMVHALIGNHEAMNVYGDLRYVTPEEFAAFETSKSADYREQSYKQEVDQLRATLPKQERPAFDDAHRAKWMAEHPPGYFEHRTAFQADGKYGRWIVRNDAVVRINDMLFLHGGLSPQYAAMSLGALNEAVQDPLQGKAPLAGSAAVDDDGPLWYRGMAQHPEQTERASVEAVLAAQGVNHVVIGHTFTEGAVLPRFGGKVIQIDVGLAAYYGGRQACLLVENGEMFSIHRGKRLRLPLGGDEELLRYLQEAAALDPEPSPLAPRIEQVEARLAGELEPAPN